MFLCPYNPKLRIFHEQSEAEFLKGMEMNRGADSARGRWAGLIVATGLSYFCYRALVARSGGDGRLLLVQAAILATLVIAYAYRCVRILGVSARLRHRGAVRWPLIDAPEKVIEQVKNFIPIGSKFEFKWKADRDKAKLEGMEGKDVDHIKARLEGEYAKK